MSELFERRRVGSRHFSPFMEPGPLVLQSSAFDVVLGRLLFDDVVTRLEKREHQGVGKDEKNLHDRQILSRRLAAEGEDGYEF